MTSGNSLMFWGRLRPIYVGTHPSCVSPSSDYLADSVDAFLTSTGNSKRTCKTRAMSISMSIHLRCLLA